MCWREGKEEIYIRKPHHESRETALEEINNVMEQEHTAQYLNLVCQAHTWLIQDLPISEEAAQGLTADQQKWKVEVKNAA